jgi:hypothetical protein
MFRTLILWLMMIASPLLSGPMFVDSVSHQDAVVKAAEGIPQMERQVFGLANQERVKAGVPPLKWNNNLAIAARLHANEMAKRNELSHQFKTEADLSARLADQGARFDAAAENVGLADAVEELHLGWMHSPLHRANLLNPRYDQMGAGIARVGDRLYATQDFAHSVAKFSPDQAEDEVIAAFRKVRNGPRLPAIQLSSDKTLRNSACSDQTNAAIPLPDGPGVLGGRTVFNYTTSDLNEIPSNLRKRLVDRDVKVIKLGACPRQDAARGFSNYRVIAVLYE